MAERVKKQDLVNQVHLSYAAFEAGLATLDAGQLTQPKLEGGWSAKDTLAHLALWHRRALDIIDPVEPPRVPGVPRSGLDAETIDAFNARWYAASKDQPLAMAMAAFRESYREVFSCIQRLSEADLMKPLVDDTRTWQIIAANTYWHYPEHLQAIQVAFPDA